MFTPRNKLHFLGGFQFIVIGKAEKANQKQNSSEQMIKLWSKWSFSLSNEGKKEAMDVKDNKAKKASKGKIKNMKIKLGM